MEKGVKLYCEIARKAARRLGPVGQLDPRAEDQDDYHSELWLRGIEAERKARLRQKIDTHAQRSAARAIWNRAYTIRRDRTRAMSRLPVSGMDVDRVPVAVDLEDQIDCKRAVARIQEYLSPESWVLVEALVDAQGGLAEAARLLGWERSKSEFVREVLALRAAVRGILCGEVVA